MADIERKVFLKAYVKDEVEKGYILLPKEGVKKIGLLQGEPVWVRLNIESNIEYLKLISKEDRKVGPQGCLVSPEDLSQLGLEKDSIERDIPIGEMEILPAKPYYPSLWSISWELPTEKPIGSEEVPEGPSVSAIAERCVICLDISGSMYGEKIVFAKMSIFTLFDKKVERNYCDELGLVTFGDKSPRAVSTRFVPTRDFSSPHRVALIEALDAYNGTPLHDGLARALKHIPGSQAPYRRVLLITDGWGDNVDDIVTQAEKLDTAIDCVGIGDDCNRQMLVNLSLRTNGRYREVRCYEDLIKEIEDLALAPAVVEPVPVQPAPSRDVSLAIPTTQPVGSSAAHDKLKEMCDRIHDLVNQQRKDNRLAPLKLDPPLAEVAVSHSDDMAGHGFFDHKNLKGKDLQQRCMDKGIQREKIGENIFCCQGIPDPARTAVTGWMNSPGHRKNILEKGFAHQGLGIAQAMDGTFFITQVFASDVI